MHFWLYGLIIIYDVWASQRLVTPSKRLHRISLYLANNPQNENPVKEQYPFFAMTLERIIKEKVIYLARFSGRGAVEQEQQRPLMPVMGYFSDIHDPRIERNTLYPLHEVIVITILAIIFMAQGREDIERYARAKEPWLRRFLDLKNGIPHHEAYRRVEP
jgi:hypothetical protein